jgi:hypothetical protein
MTIRLKVIRRQEQRISKVKDLMQMYHLDTNQYNQYQPIGASSLRNYSASIDPRIQRTKDLFEMWHLVR